MGFGGQEKKMCWLGCAEATQQLSLSMGLIGLHTQIAGQCRIVRNERDTLVENYQSEKNKKLSSGKVDLERGAEKHTSLPIPQMALLSFLCVSGFLFACFEREESVY